MDNCLFVANLPQSLNNYELAIALYLLFSKFGKVSVVKASRDNVNRPYGFVEYFNTETGKFGARTAILENSNVGIVLGGRKVRLEIAKSTAKFTIKADIWDTEFIANLKSYEKAFNLKINIGKEDENFKVAHIKVESEHELDSLKTLIAGKHKSWIIIDNAEKTNPFDSNLPIAETMQRQSGLFQLRIPENGVLPVSPATLAKINSLSSGIQYSVTMASNPIPDLFDSSVYPPSFPLQTSPLGLVNRRYEDLFISENGDKQESLTSDPIKAKEVFLSLEPSMGSCDTDVFFGRLDNQEVTLEVLLQRVAKYGPVSYLRLCNRLVSRIDNVPVDSTAYARFRNPVSAQSCIDGENGATWLGRIIKCERCWSQVDRQTPPLSHSQ